MNHISHQLTYFTTIESNNINKIFFHIISMQNIKNKIETIFIIYIDECHYIRKNLFLNFRTLYHY